MCVYVCCVCEVFRKKETLFALHSARTSIGRCDQAILVEGYMDVVSLFELGQGRRGL